MIINKSVIILFLVFVVLLLVLYIKSRIEYEKMKFERNALDFLTKELLKTLDEITNVDKIV